MSLKIRLNRRSKVDLSQQLYIQLKQLILDGTLGAGKRIPSSRELANSLKISRPTVAVSLEQLQQEGFLYLKHGSGTFVSTALSTKKMEGKLNTPLSNFGKALQKKMKVESRELDEKNIHQPKISFHCWRPALDQFPDQTLARIIGKKAREHVANKRDLAVSSCGQDNLRAAIAIFVERFRGVNCAKEQVIVVNGLHQGIDLAARLHLNRSERVIVEEPGYHGAREIFTGYCAAITSSPVDQEGIKVSALRRGKKTGLIYVTPSHQFPTGNTMTLARRLELLAWAQKENAMILEDDYDSEFSESAKPVAALMSLDKRESVIYAGTFNQIMMPSLGLGYLIVPPSLVPLYEHAKDLAGTAAAPHLQDAVAEFITAGHLESHIRKLRQLYGERRLLTAQTLKKHFGSKVRISGENAGVFLLCQFETAKSTDEIIRTAGALGVEITDTRDFYSGKAKKSEFVLGFGSLKPEQIKNGIRCLAKVILSN